MPHVPAPFAPVPGGSETRPACQGRALAPMTAEGGSTHGRRRLCLGLGCRWSLVRRVSWAHGLRPVLLSLLTDRGRGWLDALITPSSHSGPNATWPPLGAELGSQGAGRQLPDPRSPFRL